MSIRITCIKKSNGDHQDPHHAISELGWTNEQTNETGRSTRLEMYDWIKNQNGVASVADARGIRPVSVPASTRTVPNTSRPMPMVYGRTICSPCPNASKRHRIVAHSGSWPT